MLRKIAIALALLLAVLTPAILTGGAGALAKGGEFAGPGPGVTGNDIGGIFPYTPDVEGLYAQIAADWCARWQRFAKVTSVTRVYGGYVGFVCYDRTGKIY